MCPIFDVDFTEVTASIPVYEKGKYRVKITKKTPFVKESKNEESGDVTVQAGIAYSLEMVGKFDEQDELQPTDENGVSIVGKPVSQNKTYAHSKGGWQFSKPFFMAALGFKKQEEDRANKELFAGADLKLRGEPGQPSEAIETGAFWDKPVGRLVDVFMVKEVKENPKNADLPFVNQQFVAWYPVE